MYGKAVYLVVISSAVLWDLNGVIIDDMRFHLESFQLFLRELGHDMTEDYFIARCTGAPPNEVFADILPTIGNPVSIEKAVERKRQIYFEITRGRMQILPGVRQLIEGLSNLGVRQAIASGATRLEVEVILHEFGITQHFGAIVACEDVSHGKPDPEPFVTAAGCLNVNPENCLVVEDGEYGLRAARSSGMLTIAVTNTQSRENLAAADLIVDSLEEVSAGQVLDMLTTAGKLDSVIAR